MTEKKKTGATSKASSGAPNDPADIPPADTFEASGAIIEPAAKDGIDLAEPAVDSNPRAGTTNEMNRADFNDPRAVGRRVVEENLKTLAAQD